MPGVEVSSGSLGHGLPLAVGMALGLRARGLADARVFVLTGDAELDEGSNHEAIAFARAARLDTLHVVVVDNASSTHGWPGGVEARFAVEGWSVSRVSGRDHDALEAAFTVAHPGRPRMIAAVVEPKSSGRAAPRTAVVAPRTGRHRATGRYRGTRRARRTDAIGDGHGDHARTLHRGHDRPAGRAPAAGRGGRRHLGGQLPAGRDPPPGPGDQRGDPGATADQRRGRPVPGRDTADRAHVRQLPGRAPLRADQAGPEPPGRAGRRGAGQRGRVLRLLRQRAHASVAGRRGAAGHAAGLDRARAGASRRG